ncbi:MAG: glycosyltransferase [Actinomycetota bacterium]
MTVPPHDGAPTSDRGVVAVLTDRTSGSTERSVGEASPLGEVLVLDRSTGAERVGGAEVVTVDWEDDALVRAVLRERGVEHVLFVSDREELVVLDPEGVRRQLAGDPFGLVACPGGAELRAFPTADLLGRAGGPGPAVLDGILARPRLDGRPDVSVVIPTFNRTSVSEAVRSVLLQDGVAVEAIVVNDGGFDPRPGLGGAVGSSAVTVVDAERNVGMGAARNLGMEHARGDAVLFLDDDDVIDRRHVADLWAALASSGAPMVHGGAIMVHLDDDGVETARYRRPTPQFDHRLLLVHNYVVIHTALTRLDAARAIGGFDTSLGVLEDWEFWIRLTADAPASTVPIWSAEYRLRDRSGDNLIKSSAGAQLRTMERIHAAHPVNDPAVVEQRRRLVDEHRRAHAEADEVWTRTVGVIGHADPARTASTIDDLLRRHPTGVQVIAHQPAHPDAEDVLRPYLGRATICIDRRFEPSELRDRIAVQALGADLSIVEAGSPALTGVGG